MSSAVGAQNFYFPAFWFPKEAEEVPPPSPTAAKEGVVPFPSQIGFQAILHREHKGKNSVGKLWRRDLYLHPPTHTLFTETRKRGLF